VEVEGVFDILGLDDDVRTKCLALEDPQQMADVASFCNDYPNIELSFAVSDAEAICAGDDAAVTVMLEREVDEGAADIGLVKAPRYPLPKKEGWWLCVADVKNNHLLSIKRVAFQARAELQLDFIAPTEPGKHDLMLYFMCDSFLGCDQEYDFKIIV
ncbi:Ascc3l1 protein, partial [Pelagophyceae sp. CCMP2097]